MDAKNIYLDYAATTPVDPRVAEKMMQYLTHEGCFGNPASRSHAFGWQAEEAVERARAQVADLLGCDPREIVWTSGATEADNLAIKGAAHFYSGKGRHILTSAIEHKAVLDSCRQLEREGYEVTYLEPDSEGIITAEQVDEALAQRPDTTLVTLMHVNNELGTVTDIAAIGRITRERGVLLHVDAAQGAGRLPIDLTETEVDFMSLSAHKLYGPKGMGALYVRRRPRARLEAQLHGGGHERGMRSGTLATHQIVGMGEACRLIAEEREADHARTEKLFRRLVDGFADMDQVFVNGSMTQRVPGIVNISYAFVEGESLMMSLGGVALSSGSACTSASLEPSYVLRALGVDDEMAHSSLRFSIGRFTGEADIDQTIESVRHAVAKLRELSPLWDMHCEGIDLKQVQWTEH